MVEHDDAYEQLMRARVVWTRATDTRWAITDALGVVRALAWVVDMTARSSQEAHALNLFAEALADGPDEDGLVRLRGWSGDYWIAKGAIGRACRDDPVLPPERARHLAGLLEEAAGAARIAEQRDAAGAS